MNRGTKLVCSLQIVAALIVMTLAERTGDYPPISFTCPPLPPLERPARNVYELRPQDIKVVMALGDSITAGTAIQMCTLLFATIICIGFGIEGLHEDPVLDLYEYRVGSCKNNDNGSMTKSLFKSVILMTIDVTCTRLPRRKAFCPGAL